MSAHRYTIEVDYNSDRGSSRRVSIYVSRGGDYLGEYHGGTIRDGMVTVTRLIVKEERKEGYEDNDD